MFSSRVITFICMIYVMLYIVDGTRKCHEGDEYRLRVPKTFCKRCPGFVNKIDDKNRTCPDVYNVTHVFVEQLVDNMRTVAYNIETVKDKFLREVKGDKTFRPMDIADLHSVEDSGISEHVRKSSKPEEIIHKIYARVVLLSGYLELVQVMLDDLVTVHMITRHDIGSSVNSLDSKITPVLCLLYAFTEQLGISKIKKKICRYKQCIKDVSSEREETDFIITVLMEGEKYAKESVADLNSLLTDMKTCQYKKCLGNKRKLTCEGEDKSEGKRKSRKKRKDRKIKRNKKTGKGRKNRKNKDKKSSKTDLSSKGNSTQSEGMKHRRHRNKSRNVN